MVVVNDGFGVVGLRVWAWGYEISMRGCHGYRADNYVNHQESSILQPWENVIQTSNKVRDETYPACLQAFPSTGRRSHNAQVADYLYKGLGPSCTHEGYDSWETEESFCRSLPLHCLRFLSTAPLFSPLSRYICQVCVLSKRKCASPYSSSNPCCCV